MKIPIVAQDALYPAVYDSLNRLTTIRNTGNTADVASFDYDALGRRIRYEDQDSDYRRWYYYDGVNEILETDGSTDLTWYVHGVSYIDERLVMHAAFDVTETEMVDASFYYAMDRMYDVRYLLDAAGAITESYAYDPYGKSLIRECAGRGDMTGDSVVDANDDQSMFDLARDCQLFDPRADIDNDGDVDGDDATLMGCKQAVWTGSKPTSVRMARSVHGNPYMFQGRFKSFPVQEDVHFLTVCRYVEANALRARLARRAENWRWGSVWSRANAMCLLHDRLHAWPVERPRDWLAAVNRELSEETIQALRRSVVRGSPFGGGAWHSRTAGRLGLQMTLRPRGRPRKEGKKSS